VALLSSGVQTGKITPEGIQSLRDKIGILMRSHTTFNTTSNSDQVRHWADGIGDANPLWSDRSYGRNSVVGTNLASPSFLYTISMGVVQMGLAGVHSFQSGSNWHWLKPIKHNQEINFIIWLDDVVEKTSQMGGKSIVNYFSNVFYDNDQNVLAHLRTYTFRIERVANRDKKDPGLKEVELKTWTDAELAEIEAAYDREEIRGNTPRFWEEVQVGESLVPIVKGPLCLTDMIAYYAGGQTLPAPAHGLAYQHYKKHPLWWYRNPENSGLEAQVRVHEDVRAARAAGVPAPYDIGVQRNAWLIHLLTNWHGDHGHLVTCDAQYRAFNYFGDLTTFEGRVTRKYEEAGEHRVDVEITGTSQRGQVSILGTATVALPSKATGSIPSRDRLNTNIKLPDFLKTLSRPPRS